MRSKITGSILFIILCICSSIKTNAQLINNNLNISFNSNSGSYRGEEQSNTSGFIYPLFYSNLKKLNGYSGKILYKVHKFVSIGVGTSQQNGSNWQLTDKLDYLDAKVTLTSICPTIQMHSGFKENGIFNWVKIYAEVAAIGGSSKLKLENPLFDIRTGGEPVSHEMESIDAFYGVKAGAGFEFSISNSLGINANYSLSSSSISSRLYNDTNLTYSFISVGFFIRLFNNKRYYY